MIVSVFVWLILIWSVLVVIANIHDPMPNPRHSAISVAIHSIFAILAICILCGAGK